MAPPKKDRICDFCGSIHHNRHRIFCSDECKNKAGPWNRDRVGLPANRPRNGTIKQCAECGQDFYVPASRLGAQYCSMDCYHNERWNERSQVKKCIICGVEFITQPSNTKVTCGEACSRKYKSQTHKGDKSHFWRGGKTAPYVGEWRTRRREALDRDGYRCVLCESTDRIQVHHIVPYRYSKSHDLNNLVCLCRSCHSKEELKVNKSSREGLLKRWSVYTTNKGKSS